jgi:regulator of protease activity HflC (stomatin/prohibitin superfamily)
MTPPTGDSSPRNWWRRLRDWWRRNSVAIILAALIVAAVLVFFAPTLLVAIGPGQAGVLWKRFGGGTVTVRSNGKPFISRIHTNPFGDPTSLREPAEQDVAGFYPYTEGMRAIWPWDRIYLYNIRLQQVSHVYDVLTSDGLDVKAEITVRFKPIEEDLGKLHRDVGPQYVETLIVPIVGAFAREEIARHRTDELYSPARLQIQEAIRVKTKSALLSRFYPAANRESYVIVEDVLLRSIILPPEVRAAIQEKVVQKQLAEAYVYRLARERQEADRKAIEAEGIRRFQEAISGSISERYLKWKGIDATLELAKSKNSKIVVIGAGKDGLPIILGGLEPAGAETATAPAPPP